MALARHHRQDENVLGRPYPFAHREFIAMDKVRWGVVIPFARREFSTIGKVCWVGALPCARRV